MDISYLLKDESHLINHIESIDSNSNIDYLMTINIGTLLYNEQNKSLLDGLGIEYIHSHKLSCFIVNPNEISTLNIQQSTTSIFQMIDFLQYTKVKPKLYNKLKTHNNISHEFIMSILKSILSYNHKFFPILIDIIDNQLNEQKLIIDSIILYVYQNELHPKSTFNLLTQLLAKYNSQDLPLFKKEFIKNLDKHPIEVNQKVLTYLL